MVPAARPLDFDAVGPQGSTPDAASNAVGDDTDERSLRLWEIALPAAAWTGNPSSGALAETDALLRLVEQRRRSSAAKSGTRSADLLPQLAAALVASEAPATAPAPAAPSRGFWFELNAEVILYGRTDPAAQVEIAGLPVKLRSDGSFSFRFALPDGEFPLPVVALAPDGLEVRGAAVTFARSTTWTGPVSPHAQSPELQPPVPQNWQ